jgi:hypothetical protein
MLTQELGFTIFLVTFLKLSVAAVDLTWKTQGSLLSITLDEGIQLDSNDLGSDTYKKSLSIRLPTANVKVLTPSGNKKSIWLEAADINGSATIDMYLSPVGWKSLAAEQAKFVFTQDSATWRVKRLLSLLKSQRSQGRGMIFPP